MKTDDSLIETRRSIVSRYFGDTYGLTVTWGETDEPGVHGVCHCPHRDQHSDPSDERETLRVYLSRRDYEDKQNVPGNTPKVFLSCRHANNCPAGVWEDTLAIRKIEEAENPESAYQRPKKAITALIQETAEKKKLRAAAEAGHTWATKVIEGPDISEDDIASLSPFPTKKGKGHLPAYLQAQLHMELFPPDALVWVGNVEDAAKSEHIRSAAEWIKTLQILERSPQALEPQADWPWPGRFLAPCSFKTKDGGKNKENLEKRLFAVCEADSLTRAEQLKVIHAMIKDPRFPVAWVINSGSKSYHVGLRTNTTTEVDEAYLTGMKGWSPKKRGRPPTRYGGIGFDPASLRVTQAVRLAGPTHMKTGNSQRLVYINPELGYGI
jgi:hypothetical protein